MIAIGATLVTGANGFIGSRLNPEYRGLVRKIQKKNQVLGDLLESRSLLSACQGIDTIIHCAGYAHAFNGSDDNKHWDVNFNGTKNLVDVACEAGVKRFIFLSSVKAGEATGTSNKQHQQGGHATNSSGLAKRAAEEIVLAAGVRFGMHVTNLRLAMVYGRDGKGNLERMASGIRQGWFPPIPETNNKRSLIHVDDVIDAIYAVAMNPLANGKTYVVTDGTAYSGRFIYDSIRNALGMRPTKRCVPAGLLRLLGHTGDIIGSLQQRPFAINSQVISRLLDSEYYSSDILTGEIGWRARKTLPDGLQEMLHHEKTF